MGETDDEPIGEIGAIPTCRICGSPPSGRSTTRSARTRARPTSTLPGSRVKRAKATSTSAVASSIPLLSPRPAIALDPPSGPIGRPWMQADRQPFRCLTPSQVKPPTYLLACLQQQSADRRDVFVHRPFGRIGIAVVDRGDDAGVFLEAVMIRGGSR